MRKFIARFLDGIPLLALAAVIGCSSFLHFADPAAQAVSCAITGDVLPILSNKAQLCGVFAPECQAVLESIFGSACATAAANGATQAAATKAGTDAVLAKPADEMLIDAQMRAQYDGAGAR